jgi:dipeptidyl aminopeptidase/acylaminoacyl peptidase
MRLAPLTALIVLCAVLPTAAIAQKRAFTTADWYRLSTLSAPAISPDGRLAAVTVTTVRESENKRHSEVWVVSTAGGIPVRYTSPGFESSAPRFSPDGRYLLFTSVRPGGKGNTWAIRLDQPSGEASQVPGYPAGSMPANKSFAVFTEGDTAKTASTEKDPFAGMQAMARPPFGSITKPVDAKRFDGRHVIDFGYVSNGPGFVPNRREARVWRPAQLVTQSMGDTVRRRVTSTAYSHRSAAVSPDGRWIAFVADPLLRSDSAVAAERDSIALLPYNAARDEAPENDGDIFVIPVAGGTPRRITTAAGTESSLRWSPDGTRITYTSAPTNVASTRLYSVGANGGEPLNLLGDWKYEPGGYEWINANTIQMSAAIGGRTAIMSLDVRTMRMTELVGGRRQITGTAYDAKHTRIAFVATSITQPTELYVADADGRNERKLTSFNDALNAEVAWSDAERFTYTSVGGVEIEAWLQKPYGYEPGRKYPMVLYVHGGPHSAYGEGWFDEFQNLSAEGMYVLFTNPRGSSGYGGEFQYSTRGRWGAEDYEDLMKAVDIVSKRADVDSTRMGVTGGSYGGFMTAWITTKTTRFKAAQTDRMISNWYSWYGSSDVQGLTEFEFYGKPWDNYKLYDELSPIRYVQNVRTPTLIVQSEDDHRTPIGDAEQWFMALRKQGVPAEFVRYPRSTHELSRSGEPWLLVDRLGRLRQWFTHWLVPAAATSTP